MDSQSNQHFYAQQRPAYPQSSYNQSTSTFQSSASLSSLASISTSPSQTNMNSRHSPTLVSAAPMSSPASQSQYFSLPAPMGQDSHHFQQMHQRPQQHRGSFCEEQRPSGLNDASPFLQDFSLIAEAAKRAQMAVMMRDFDDLEM